MKKALIISILAAMVFAGCKKKENQVSQLVTVSYPVITFTGGQYYSIPIGGTLPTINATGEDTVYHKSYPVTIDQSTLDNTTPGLYIVIAQAKNDYGYISTANVYVAVTNIPAAINLGGPYQRTTGVDVNITKLATGLYVTDNVGGVAPPGAVVPAYFVQVNDSTLIVPQQNDPNVGAFNCINATVSMAPADTTVSWIVENPAGYFLDNVRTFVKQ